MKRRIQDDRQQFWHIYYQHVLGVSIDDLAKQFGFPAAAIIQAFRAERLQVNLPSQAKPAKRGRPRISERWPDDLVKQMHADHIAGMRLCDLARKYSRQSRGIRQIFVRRGLAVLNRGNAGQFAQTMHRHSDAEVQALVEQSRKFVVPHVLRVEWREWDLERRSFLIRLLVAKHGRRHSMPEGPFSANVEPFDYTSPKAHEIAARMNQGLNSRDWVCHMKIQSQGVIFDDQLYFWVRDNGYVRGHFQIGVGRAVLHRLIYTLQHGEIPDDGVVRFADGNPNNLDPANLYLASRNDLARENQSAHWTKISRARTAALLKRHNTPTKTSHHGPESILG